MSAFAFSMEEEDHTISLPAFFAARESSSSIKLCAGSPSGNRSIKFSTCRTTSSLLRYWYKPSDERTRNWSLAESLWWQREGVHDIYGVSPIYSLRNISSNPSFNFACKACRLLNKIYLFPHTWTYHNNQPTVSLPVWDTQHQMHG